MPTPKRPRGRPRRADAPVVPWDEVDRLLVFGETARDPETGREDARFPSLAELGERYGVSKNRVWQYAVKRKCLERREEARAREAIRYDQKVVEQRAEARALATEDELRIIDAYLRGFDEAVRQGKVRFDSPADFNTMVRLKEFKLGNADSRQAVIGTLTLEAIQARHQRLRAQVEPLTPEVQGLAAEADEPEGDADAAPAP